MGIRSPKSDKRKKKGRRWKTNPNVLSIEDPFDLNHNLGGGLSKKMNVYIMKTFIKGRERFGAALTSDKMYKIYKQEVSYFFYRNFLNSGREPPHDRGCGNCGKIGHKRKDCPQEKTCSYCRRPGHLVKNCPRKGQGQQKDQRNMKKGNRYNYDSPNNERKGSVEKIQNQRMPPHHPMLNNDVMRTYPGMQHQNPPFDSQQKLLKLGVPIHRMPPPGFVGRTPGNPPPGFKNNAQLLPTPINYPPPFPGIPPFPRPVNKKEMLSQSPPKPYSASPPKNFQQNKVYQMQDPSGWTMNPRNAPFHVERHPNPQRMMPGNGRGHWMNNRPMMPHPPQHKSNQHQTMDHRRNRTNSDHQPYNSNSDRWSSR